MRRRPFEEYEVETVHRYRAVVGCRGPCVFEIYADGALRYIGTSVDLSSRLSQMWGRNACRLRSDFERWTIRVWRHRTERAMLRERDRRIDAALRWNVETLRPAKTWVEWRATT